MLVNDASVRLKFGCQWWCGPGRPLVGLLPMCVRGPLAQACFEHGSCSTSTLQVQVQFKLTFSSESLTLQLLQ